MNINRVLFTGNLTAEPEVNYTPKGTAVVNASLANNEFYTSEGGERQQITTYVDVNIWGKPAENLAKKGQEIFVEASLPQEKQEDDEGNKHSKHVLRVISWQFTQRKSQEDQIEDAAQKDVKETKKGKTATK